MRQFWLCIVFILTVYFSVYGAETIPANDPNIQYTGRVYFGDPLAPIMWWPGNYIIANFEGTSIKAKFNDYGDNYFYSIIDDGAPVLHDLMPGARTYTIATGLTDSAHKVMLFKRTETQEGEVAFTGFELDDGKVLQPPPERPQRRIEFYGDSITSGHSVASLTGDTNKAEGKDNYYAYGAVTARNLGAEYHCISVSGIGLYIDKWDFGGNMQTLYYYKHTSSTTWDFGQWTPHIVVVNLGQNDYWGEYTQEGAEQAYVDFTLLLRAEYPDAHIILALGSMSAVEAISPWPGYLHNALEYLRKNYNETKVYEVIFPYSGSSHPDVERQDDMATQLTNFIQKNIPGFGSNPDTNSDDYVDNTDFCGVSSEWLESECGPCDGMDVTGDGNVNMDDLVFIAELWLADVAFEGHWKFDESAGTTAEDSSVYGHDGTLVKMDDSDWVEGYEGNCLEFDGIDDYVVMLGFKGIEGSRSRTCAAWVKPAASTDARCVISWGTQETLQKWVFGLFDTDLGVRVLGGNVLCDASDVFDGEWHHVAAVFGEDGSADISDTSLYIDGVKQVISGANSCRVQTGAQYNVKVGQFAGESYFEGLIDDVRIYDRALSADEIAEIAN